MQLVCRALYLGSLNFYSWLKVFLSLNTSPFNDYFLLDLFKVRFFNIRFSMHPFYVFYFHLLGRGINLSSLHAAGRRDPRLLAATLGYIWKYLMKY